MRRVILLLLFAFTIALTAVCAQAQGAATPRKVLVVPGSCDPTGSRGDVILWKITAPNVGLWTCDPVTKTFEFQTNTFGASLTAETMLYADAAAAVVSTAAPTNGQILIGDTGNIPALGTITATANETAVTNGAHSITIGLAASLKHKAGSFFQLTDSTDATKIAQFDLSNIGAGATRSVNLPNADSTTVQSGAAVANQFVTDITPQGVVNRAQPTEANLSTSDITANNVTSTKHGFAPKSPADATRFLNGAATPAYAQVNTTDLATAVSGPLAGTGTAVAAANANHISAPQGCEDVGGTDSYECSLSPAITAYVVGAHYRVKANTQNTGAATINLNGIGAVTITKPSGDLESGDIGSNQWVEFVYNGTFMVMQSQSGNAAPPPVSAADASISVTGGAVGLPYKVYTVLLSQSGTDAPTATILTNTLSGTPTLTRNLAGDYSITLTGEFPALKTFVIFQTGAGNQLPAMEALRTTDNMVRVFSSLSADDELSNRALEIRVYP